MKYTLYFFQKTFVFSTNFIFLLLVSTTINAQFSDTIKFKYRDSKVLIVSKSSTDNEWEFENSLTDEKVNNNKMKMNFSVGNIHLNNNSIEWTGDLTGTESPKEITIDKAKNVTAVFIKKQYPLTVEIKGEGTVAEKVIKAGAASDYNSGTV